MLRLVFQAKGPRLKVRLGSPSDDFSKSYRWKDELEYILDESQDFMILWSSLLPDLKAQYAQALLSLVSARYPLSEDFNELKNSCPQLLIPTTQAEWVFYGGSFNPWHQGHQACINLLPEEKLCFILLDRNPQKELISIDPVATYLEIGHQCRLKKNQYLVPTFLLSHKTNPTVEWVTRLKNDYPEKSLSLLMGFDSFYNLDSWIRIQDLLSHIHCIYVVSRLEQDEQRADALKRISELAPNTEIIFLGRHDFEDRSSTHLRRKI